MTSVDPQITASLFKSQPPSANQSFNHKRRCESHHEATCVADQEDCRSPVLPRRAQPSEHVLRWPVFLPLRELLEQLLHHGGDDVAGGDGVDADVVLSPFAGQVAAELDDAGFGCVVRWADESLVVASVAIAINNRANKNFQASYVPYSQRCRSY